MKQGILAAVVIGLVALAVLGGLGVFLAQSDLLAFESVPRQSCDDCVTWYETDYDDGAPDYTVKRERNGYWAGTRVQPLDCAVSIPDYMVFEDGKKYLGNGSEGTCVDYPELGNCRDYQLRMQGGSVLYASDVRENGYFTKPKEYVGPDKNCPEELSAYAVSAGAEPEKERVVVYVCPDGEYSDEPCAGGESVIVGEGGGLWERFKAWLSALFA